MMSYRSRPCSLILLKSLKVNFTLNLDLEMNERMTTPPRIWSGMKHIDLLVKDGL